MPKRETSLGALGSMIIRLLVQAVIFIKFLISAMNFLFQALLFSTDKGRQVPALQEVSF
jgi:hypothetical protein